MLDAVFVVPLGPGDAARLKYVLASVQQHCRNFHVFVLADGIPEGSFDRMASDVVSFRYFRSSNRNWGEIWMRQCLAMRDALTTLPLSEDCVFVKIDADALIVRSGVVERAQALFLSRPKVGQLGQCRANLRGAPLQNLGWKNYLKKITSPLGLLRFIRFSRKVARLRDVVPAWMKLRYIIQIAYRNLYSGGEFSIGGAYILRPDVVRRISERGWLDGSPFRLLPLVGEDVVMGLHVYASGYYDLDDSTDGGLFAVCGEEPWIHPFELQIRGHYVIHPLKYGSKITNPELSEHQLVTELLGYEVF